MNSVYEEEIRRKRESGLKLTEIKELEEWYKAVCLLYTSDAADDTPCVDLGGRRIIKKKKKFFFFFFFFFFFLFFFYFFFFSSRRRHTRSSTVSWARRCV